MKKNFFNLLLIISLIFGLSITACAQSTNKNTKKQTVTTTVSNKKDYAYVKAPKINVPVSLQGDTWLKHYNEDIKPFWVMPDALGKHQGNFPTCRGMDGKALEFNTDRRPRMISRQIYVYAMGYMMTGDEKLLQYAKDGCDWLINHVRDTKRGGWYELLDADGNEVDEGNKYAQDTAYCMLGLAAYYFVTRDKDIEQEILYTRDMLFDNTKYWDDKNKRIRDAMNYEMTEEVDDKYDDGWELVAQLDQLNAFMILVQPVLSDEARRNQFLNDMRTLSDSLIKNFWKDGIFWGVHNKKGAYGTEHVDFGHTLKTYWMIMQTDKRLPDHPFYSFIQKNAYKWVDLAYDSSYGRWAGRMTSQTTVDYGNDWWIYAEEDQFASTLNLLDYRYTNRLAKTSKNWLNDFVDKKYKEIYPSITRDGKKGWDWGINDAAKCNEWKNGYHVTEHSLIMYILGKNLENKKVDLYFAVPTDQANNFIAKPYYYDAREVGREKLGEINIDDKPLQKVKVSFDQIH